MMQLQGARVVVVEGSRGIGLAAARQARQAGADVTIVGRSPERLAQARQVLGEVRTIAADIADATAIGEVFAGLDHVDHVLVSAGTIRHGALVDSDLKALHRLSTNVSEA